MDKLLITPGVVSAFLLGLLVQVEVEAFAIGADALAAGNHQSLAILLDRYIHIGLRLQVEEVRDIFIGTCHVPRQPLSGRSAFAGGRFFAL